MRPMLLAAVPILLLAGCAADAQGGDAPAGTAATQEPRYQTTATVLQNRDHGPELCLGIVLTSFPPQCGGLPITNWHCCATNAERSPDVGRVPGSDAVREMKEGPSESPCGGRLQTTTCCVG